MADSEFGTVESEDFQYSEDDLEPYGDVAEEVEKKADGENEKQSKQIRKLAEKQARMEAQLEREKLVGEFYSKASDEAKELADVLIAGVADPDRVKKMLSLAEAKAATMAGTATSEQEADSDEDEVERAFAAPPGVSPPEVRDVGKETTEKTRSGNAKAALWEFLAAPAKGGPETR